MSALGNDRCVAIACRQRSADLPHLSLPWPSQPSAAIARLVDVSTVAQLTALIDDIDLGTFGGRTMLFSGESIGSTGSGRLDVKSYQVAKSLASVHSELLFAGELQISRFLK